MGSLAFLGSIVESGTKDTFFLRGPKRNGKPDNQATTGVRKQLDRGAGSLRGSLGVTAKALAGHDRQDSVRDDIKATE